MKYTDMLKIIRTSLIFEAYFPQKIGTKPRRKCLKKSRTEVIGFEYVFRRNFHEVSGDIICPSQVRGIDYLRDARINKGLGFTIQERQMLGIHGLMPPQYASQEEQLLVCKLAVRRYANNLNKYIYLTELQEYNERLFYRLLTENVEELMPIVYTPTVGQACQQFGLLYKRPRGLFITIHDKGHVFEILKNWPENDVRAIVVTDGERILGLGDLGACGMGIPVGKLSLYTGLAGIKPHQCLPILLDVGTNNKDLLDDPLYVGLRRKRVTGVEYDDLIDEFMEAVVKRFGQTTLIQFEDFGFQNAYRLLLKYRSLYCTFNDDIQGTAAVCLAGLFAASRLTKISTHEQKFVFLGAGGAALGIAYLIVKHMIASGLSSEEAFSRIWMVDIDGLLAKDRVEGGIGGLRQPFVKDHAPTKDLEAIVKEVKPGVLIGASTSRGAFTKEIIQEMGRNNERPIIFSLSNPTSNSECTAEDAIVHTDGRVIFASGSPFPPVEYKGKTFHTGQGNNSYIFPGVALGIIATKVYHVNELLFMEAAQTVADACRDEDLEQGRVYPDLSRIREVSLEIALRIARMAYEKNWASVYPKPTDIAEHIKSVLYNFDYESVIPKPWPWPELEKRILREIRPQIKNNYLKEH